MLLESRLPRLLVKSPLFSVYKVAGEGGFEPPITGPKPVALPLGYSPLKLINFILDSGKIQSEEGCNI